MMRLKIKQLLFATLLSLLISPAFGQEATLAAVDTGIYVAELLDIKPTYQGGEMAMFQAINQYLRFPMDAR